MITFDLNLIAARLEGLEETIITKLIDRAQFSVNQRIYEQGSSGFEREPQRSLFELRLLYQEKMDAEFGRFCVPEERPFNEELPESRRVVKLPDTGLYIDSYNRINLTTDILPRYLSLMHLVCKEGEDGHFGSSVEHDVYAIQAIARRIHYGSFYVAESKYRAAPDTYKVLVAAHDEQKIMELLTRKEVEEKIIERVREKVVSLQANVNRQVRHYVDPSIIVTFYRETIIPLTKKGEVAYLMNRGGDN